MKIGIRLHDAAGSTLPERLENAKKQGFTCGHLALTKAAAENSTADGALTPGYAAYVKKLFAQQDMDIAVLGCYLNLGNPNPEQQKEILHHYMAHIRFASWLGCGVVGTETGAPNEQYQTGPECRSEEAFQIFLSNMRKVVEYAEKMGVVVGMEPVCTHIVYSAQRARRVLDEIASPNLQIILDPVNLIPDEEYSRAPEIIREAIRILGEDVAVVHIKDFEIADGKVKAVAAGTGRMDYTDLMRFIKEQKPYVYATLEDTVPENAEQARRKMQELWEKA